MSSAPSSVAHQQSPIESLPLVGLLASFAIGIWIAAMSSISVYIALPLLLLSLTTWWWWTSRRRFSDTAAKSRQMSYLAWFIFLLLGFARARQYDQSQQPCHFSHYLTDSSLVVARINEPTLARAKTDKTTLLVTQVINGTQSIYTCGNALAYFQRDTTRPPLNYGDVIVLDAPFKSIAAPLNPYEFDFKTYAKRQNIFQQIYLKTVDWQPLGNNQANPIWQKVYRLRTACLQLLDRYVTTAEEKKVAQALLLGDKADLDTHITAAYRETGAMHILAVSGLHVGFIAIIFNTILSLLFKPLGNRGRWLQFTVVSLVVWLFACIAGLAPSIARAALMFSLIGLGKLYSNRYNIYNIIAGSAFMLLIINPFMLTDVGFQLSYLAVISLVYYYPKFVQLASFESVIAQKAYESTAVSIAAQIGTLPLVVYYFGQFPIYALLANLIAVPLSSFALWLGLLLIVCSPLPMLATGVGKALGWCIWLLDHYLYAIAKLPNAVIPGISINNWQVILCYALLIFLIIWVQLSYPKRPLQFALLSAVGLMLFQNWRHWQSYQQSEIVVFHTPNGSALAAISGKNTYLFADAEATDSLKRSRYYPPLALHKGIAHTHSYPIDNQGAPDNPTGTVQLPVSYTPPFWEYDNHKWLWLHGTLALPDSLPMSPATFSADFALLSHNAQLDLIAWQQLFHFKTVVIDGSNSPWHARQLAKQCELLGIHPHNTAIQGAYIVKIPPLAH